MRLTLFLGLRFRELDESGDPMTGPFQSLYMKRLGNREIDRSLD